MESHPLLSNNQYFYIVSQMEKLSDDFNKSQDLKRLNKKIEKCFDTFELILDSKSLSLEYKHQLFNHVRLKNFLKNLVTYSQENTFSEEENKQLIAQDCLTTGFTYFQRRYSQKMVFLDEKIQEINNIIDMVNQLVKEESKETKSIEFYKLRKSMSIPPVMQRSTYGYNAMCRICWSMTSANTKVKSMKGIRHHKHCPFDKKDLERCIEVKSPLKKN